MANPTECQTDGAIYSISINPTYLTVGVELPFDLVLDSEESNTLRNNIHNAMELVLAKYFFNRTIS